MGLILDSTVVIAAERRGRTAYQILREIGSSASDPEVAISVITVLELAHGVARADSAVRRADRQNFLDDLLAGVPIHPVTAAVALRAGILDGHLQAAGTRIALADLLIGCTALELGYEVATTNTRHFEAIPGLKVRTL